MLVGLEGAHVLYVSTRSGMAGALERQLSCPINLADIGQASLVERSPRINKRLVRMATTRFVRF